MEGCLVGVKMVTNHQLLARLMGQQMLTWVQMRWLRLGLFQSICPTIKYQLRKANVVADALSRSQRTDFGDPMDNMVAATMGIKEQLMTLSEVSVELTGRETSTMDYSL